MEGKTTSNQGWVFIGVVALLVIGSWVGFEVYRNLTNTTLTQVQQDQIRPLDPEIDAETLANLRRRRRFNESDLATVQSLSLFNEEVSSGAASLVIDDLLEEENNTQQATESAEIIEESQAENATGSATEDESFAGGQN